MLFDTQNHGQGAALGYLGPFLAASLMASYVLYGFDTAGALAEETDTPRRRAPWAILQALAAAATAGLLLILFGILAVSDPRLPELRTISGGLPFLVKDVLGEKLGVLLLVEVIFAVFVCALAVHAASVRLIFAMARDNNLPFAHTLSHVSPRTRAPIVPALVVGVLAAAILVLNVNIPNVIEMLCSIAIIWANLAYLMVTLPLLLSRRRRGKCGPAVTKRRSQEESAGRQAITRPYFSLGRWGSVVNTIAVLWGLFVVTNIGWPRTAVYGTHPWGRFAGPLATLALIAAGTVYYFLYQRRQTGIMPEHAASDGLDAPPTESKQSNDGNSLDRLACTRRIGGRTLMRSNESGLRRIARRSATLVKLQVRKRQKPAHLRPARPPGPFERFLGWCVHGYPALGMVAAGLIAVLLVQGGPSSFRWCFLLMAAATIVDATDGYLARKVRIKEVVPSFDGRRLDDLVDFLTYTFLPLLLIWRAGILPQGQEAWLFLPLLASAYGFCQVQAKTDDGYFLGFPSLWNVVALYLYVLPLGPWLSLAVVIVLATLTFVPTRYLYPSQPGRLNRVATLLGVPWTVLFVWLIWELPRESNTRFDATTMRWAWISLIYPLFYLGVSWAISVAYWRKRFKRV